MSDLPTAALSYQAVVTEYFLGLRGAGLMVSPLDAELVGEWERRGVPVAVVCRGLRRGMENEEARRPGGRGPRSIRALRLAVEDEWHAYQLGRVGESPPPPGEDAAAAARLEAARALLVDAALASDPQRRDGYRAAWRALAAPFAGTPLERAQAAVGAADDAVLRAWVAGLPRPERAAMGPRLRLLCGPRAAGTTRRAYREALRAHLFDALRAAGLTCLRGSV